MQRQSSLSGRARQSHRGIPPDAERREFKRFHEYADENTHRIVGGRYRLGNVIGRGGIGVIYRATDLDEKLQVAVKIREIGAGKRMCRRRITEELEALQRVDHKNIIAVKSAGVYKENPYVVMEYMEGLDLYEYMNKFRILPLETVKSIISQICWGLDALHQEGITHRDIKPENVFVFDDGTVKLFDFDLSEFEIHKQEEDEENNKNKIVGTPHYLAPERWGKQQPHDRRADVWAVGVILYQMLCDRLPFIAEQIVGVAYRIINSSPTPPTKINPLIPKEAEMVVLKALEKDPEKRFGSAKEMGEAVLRIPDEQAFVLSGQVAIETMEDIPDTVPICSGVLMGIIDTVRKSVESLDLRLSMPSASF